MTMATLVLDKSNVALRADGATIAVYEAGERCGSLPLNLIERVVIQGGVNLDTRVLTRFAEQGIATVLLSGRQSRRLAYVLGAGHSDAAIRLGQYEAAMNKEWCAAWARRAVLGKLRGHTRLLRRASLHRPDCRKPLLAAQQDLENAVSALAAEEGQDLARVRGIEGAAAAAFFGGFAALMPESLGFNGRNRRPPRDPVNACLSLGYTLLHFEAVRSCHAAGLDPLIGFYHRPAFGRESLACDLVEPLRPRIDAWVWALMRERVLRQAQFAFDKGACLLRKPGRERYYAEYERFAPPIRRFLRRECALLARLLQARGESQVEPPSEFEEEGE